MKILIRSFSLIIIGMIIIAGFIYLINTSIIINELNNASALAIEQTQNVMKKIVISDLDRNRIDLFDGTSYEDYYQKCFNEAVKDPNLYELYVEGDDRKGLIHVIVDVPKYRLIPRKELLNIINVEGEGLDDLEALYYETTISSKKTKVNQNWTDFSPKALISLQAEEGKTKKITEYSFLVDAKNSSGDARSIIGPYIEVNCTDKDGKKELLGSAEGGLYNQSALSSTKTCECSLFELSLPEGVDKNEFAIKPNILELVRGSNYYVEEIETKVFKKDFKLSTVVDISKRYINDIQKLSQKSIWQQNKEYKEVLEGYIEKLK